MRFRHASARVGRIVAHIVGPATYPSTCRGTRWGHDLRPAASVRLSRRQAMGSLASPNAGTVSGLPARGGCRARTSRLLAICATEITSPEGRRELTQCWDRILHEGRRPPIPRPPCAPLCRDRVTAAERDVRDMLTVLAGPLPITAHGAAMASFSARHWAVAQPPLSPRHGRCGAGPWPPPCLRRTRPRGHHFQSAPGPRRRPGPASLQPHHQCHTGQQNAVNR
jgi:hypothetical protein